MLNEIMRLDNHWTTALRLPASAGFARALAGFLAHTGDSWYWLAALGLLWLFGGAPWHNAAAFMATCVVILAILVFSVKFVIRRQRPPGEWGEIYRSTDPHSFPSGHATRAGLLIVLAWSLLPGTFAIILTLWAPLMALSRVAMGVHYLSDILAGFLLGILSALLLLFLQPQVIMLLPFLFY